MNLRPAVAYFSECFRLSLACAESARALSIILDRIHVNLGSHRELLRVDIAHDDEFVRCLLVFSMSRSAYRIFEIGNDVYIKKYDQSRMVDTIETRTIPLADIDHPEKWYDVVRFILEPVNDSPDQPNGVPS